MISRICISFLLLIIAASAAPPNVIIILTDDQGYGDFSSHGNPVLKTPAIDKLRSESIRLADFHVTPMCTSTRSHLMTGRHALVNGAYHVTSGRTAIRPEIPTMAELLAARGYRTGLFGKWHLGDNYPHRPNDRGFQEAVYHQAWGITASANRWNSDYFDDYYMHNGVEKQYQGYCTDVFFSEAQDWLRQQASATEPFFLYLALNAPHGPFYCPDEYKEPYRNLDPDTAGFFGMLANLDENIATLETTLTELELRENTVVIYMTDNGGTGGINVFNAGLRGAKASLYEGGHRAAGFVRWPSGDLRAPGDVGGLTEATDILPTLLDLCDVSPVAGTKFDGISLEPLLRGQDQPELANRKLVVQYGGIMHSDPVKWDAAIMWGPWRLVNGDELYQVHQDVDQSHNVAALYPGVVQTLRKHYETWWEDRMEVWSNPVPIGVGSPRENPTKLTSMDWYAPRLTPAAQPFDIRLAGQSKVVEGSLPGGRPQPARNGPWNLEVETAGHYQISLRRWPKEADTPMTSGLPAFHGVDGDFPAGVALPIAETRLRIGKFDARLPVGTQDKAAVYELYLPSGPVQMQTWFYDAAGEQISGAYYVDVLHTPHKKPE